ncbi:hypothetical protein [Streptomyces tagetis]|uniref:Tetratricopeptide repeat protein n=1 Tax=Streptomyces tagetis TaxID=2820809 RepID=A0A940XFR0_9ACTN|nr:hypothetical protein [Streptomyces sp. RG38]MBQ0827506.1 hypothetical protein [Streptomyces sp. RG38]
MTRFDVYMSDDGLAYIDGDPLAPAPDASVHEAVLDRLQRHAERYGTSVEATVTDGPGETHFVLEVAPDGSSRVLVPEETPEEAAAPEEPTAPEPEAPASAIATAVARARATAAARTPPPNPAPEHPDPRPEPRPEDAPEPEDTPEPEGAPDEPRTSRDVIDELSAPVVAVDLAPELAERIARINVLASAGRLDEAFDDATELRETMTAQVGAAHPNALEARSVAAYLAHLRGDPREATVLALGVARIRCGAGDRRAPEEVARAAAAWQHLDDDRAVVIHGRELLHMWGRLDARGRLSPEQVALAERVRGHVEALEAYV